MLRKSRPSQKTKRFVKKRLYSEAYLEHCQTSRVELFEKITQIPQFYIVSNHRE